MNVMPEQPIYLDYHATTPVDDRVLAAMLPYFNQHFGNPASLTHPYGWAAAAAVKQARDSLSAAIHASPEELIFTSGATEANNLAIKGVAEANFSRGRHLITIATEHNAVLDPCRYLESLGFELTILPVQSDGLVNLAILEQAIRPETILVSVMAANNEIGVLQPIAEIGAICHGAGVLFHTDAAQAIGKIPLDRSPVAATQPIRRGHVERTSDPTAGGQSESESGGCRWGCPAAGTATGDGGVFRICLHRRQSFPFPCVTGIGAIAPTGGCINSLWLGTLHYLR